MHPQLMVPDKRIASPFAVSGHNIDPRKTPIRKSSGGGPPAAGLLFLQDHLVQGDAGFNVANFALNQNFTNDAMAFRGGGGADIIYPDEYVVGGAPPSPTLYECRWVQISGVLDQAPLDDSGFNALPQNQWSFSEWVRAHSIGHGLGWSGGVFAGPMWSQFGGSATCSIRVDIRKIDLTDGPVSGVITLDPF